MLKKVLVLVCMFVVMLNLCACGSDDKTAIGEGVVMHLVRVRREPSVDAEIVTVLKEGQKVSILEEYDDFYQIFIQAEDETQDTNEAIEGYVRKQFITLTE